MNKSEWLAIKRMDGFRWGGIQISYHPHLHPSICEVRDMKLDTYVQYTGGSSIQDDMRHKLRILYDKYLLSIQ